MQAELASSPFKVASNFTEVLYSVQQPKQMEQQP